MVGSPTSTTDSHLKRIISTNCCVHTVVPPEDGLDTTEKYKPSQGKAVTDMKRNSYDLQQETFITLPKEIGVLFLRT